MESLALSLTRFAGNDSNLCGRTPGGLPAELFAHVLLSNVA